MLESRGLTAAGLAPDMIRFIVDALSQESRRLA
jgi:hypothetical protein